MKTLLTVMIGLLMFVSPIKAMENMQEAIDQTQQDIKKAVSELSELRSKHIGSKLKLQQQLTMLEHVILPLRQKREQVQEQVWQKDNNYQDLQQEVAFLKEELQFCSAVITEYKSNLKTRMSLAEVAYYKEKIAQLETPSHGNSAFSGLDKLEALLQFTQERNELNLGGAMFEGKALDDKGKLHNGTFLHIGPLHYFYGKLGKVAGLVGIGLGSIKPAIIVAMAPESLSQLVRGNEAAVAIDVTLGDAVKVKKQKKSWSEHIRAGGVVMVPILFLGVACIILAIWKWMALSKLNIQVQVPLITILDLANHNKIKEAEKTAEQIGEPVGPVLIEGIRHYKAPKEHVEEIMHEKIMGQIPFLEKNLAFLAVSAAASPLLGLLGTVIGMIHTFDLVAVFGTGKVNVLSGGISEALITTEFGLIVAIPTLLIHAYLSRKVKHIVHALEQTATGFINGLQVKRKKTA